MNHSQLHLIWWIRRNNRTGSDKEQNHTRERLLVLRIVVDRQERCLPLLVRRDSFLIFDLQHHIQKGTAGFNRKSLRFDPGHFDEDLHDLISGRTCKAERSKFVLELHVNQNCNPVKISSFSLVQTNTNKGNRSTESFGQGMKKKINDIKEILLYSRFVSLFFMLQHYYCWERINVHTMELQREERRRTRER